MSTITVKLSAAEFRRLEPQAAAGQRTKSDGVREALARGTPDDSSSLLEAMRPYPGKLSAPGDLSTDKARRGRGCNSASARTADCISAC